MTTLVVFLWVLVLVGLLIVIAFRPERTRQSWSELHRLGDKQVIRREKLLGDILGLRRVVTGLLLICLLLVSMAIWHSLGIAVTMVVWLVSGAVTRWKPIHTQVMKLYKWLEPKLLNFAENASYVGWLVKTEKYAPHDQHLESAEHLLHLVESSSHVLTHDQQDIIRRGINWHTTTVGSIMTPAKDIFSVKSHELLGPLVLDDLHKSGHYRFPVMKGNVQTVVGILDISNLLDLSIEKKSESAEKVMSPELLTVESDEMLPVALTRLEKSKQHMIIIVDGDGKTVGLVTLADITGSLLGKNRGGVV